MNKALNIKIKVCVTKIKNYSKNDLFQETSHFIGISLKNEFDLKKKNMSDTCFTNITWITN